MANSTTNIDNILVAQAGKEVVANAFFDAASPATAYGRRASACGGLVWGYYGANILAGGAYTQIDNGTLTLTASQANIYVEARLDTGAITQNNTGWTPGRMPLYRITTGSSTVTSYTDFRLPVADICPFSNLTITGSVALSSADALSKLIILGGTPAAAFNVTVAATPWIYAVRNNTGQTATFTTGSGSTVAIATGMSAQIFTDGTQVLRLSADI